MIVRPISGPEFDALIPADAEFFSGDEPISREQFEAATERFRQAVYHPAVCEVIDERGRFLEGKASIAYSQFGEDGLLAALFEEIGIRNAWCFEVGASDGTFCSNTKLLREQGWHSVLIERDRELFLKLSECELQSNKSHLYLRDVGPKSLDSLLAHAQAPLDIDLGVIDVDGQDYHLFAGLCAYQPRVMVVEFSTRDDPPPALGEPGQAGLTAILELGRSKGYAPLVRTNVNVIFALEDCL